MALTDEEVKEINSALEAGKTISEIEALKPLGDVVLRTQEQETKFKENFTRQIEEEKIAPRISEIYKQVDDDVFGITGVKREQGVKTYDYLKSQMGVLKTKVDGSESTIAELKIKIEGEGADVLRKELEQLNAKYSNDIGAKDNEIENMQKQHLRFSKTRLVDAAFSQIKGKFIQDLPGYFDSHKNTVLESIIKNSKLTDDGKGLVLLKADGTGLKDANVEPMKLESFLMNEFKEVIQQGDGAGGAGGGSGETEAEKAARLAAGGKENDWEKIQKPETVKTQVELRSWIIEKHPDISRGDRIKAMEKLSVGLPIQ